jgi:YceI-like domain
MQIPRSTWKKLLNRSALVFSASAWSLLGAAVLTACASTTANVAVIPPAVVAPAAAAPAVAAPAVRPGGVSGDLAARYRALAATGGQVFALDATRSAVRIYAFRGGKAAQYGHNHVLSAPAFEGYFYLAPGGALVSRFDLAFRLDQLVVDAPEHRAATGGAFASVLSASATESTRDNMLGDFGLQAAQYPWVRIQSVQIAGEDPKFAARVAVELHGQTRDIWVPLQVSGLPDHLAVQGAMVLLQTDFGVKPFSVLGGLLSVQDPLVLEFSLQGVRVAAPGSAPAAPSAP